MCVHVWALVKQHFVVHTVRSMIRNGCLSLPNVFHVGHIKRCGSYKSIPKRDLATATKNQAFLKSGSKLKWWVTPVRGGGSRSDANHTFHVS
jgi:hypothetical protein